jgi:hypothetical protein
MGLPGLLNFRVTVMHEQLLHLIFLLFDLPALLLHFFLSLLPFLVHPLGPLLRVLARLAAILLLGDPVRLEWMILFELLVIKGLLAEFLTLHGLVVLVQTCVSPIDILLSRR